MTSIITFLVFFDCFCFASMHDSGAKILRVLIEELVAEV